MELYLIQHAEAKSKEEDPERGLSETGFANIRKSATFVKKLAITVDVIYHSDKLRAVQSAKELSGTVNSITGLKQREKITPMDDITSLKEEVNKTDKNIIRQVAATKGSYRSSEQIESSSPKDKLLRCCNIMVVGHLPYLNKLASALLCGDENRNIVSFQNGCIVKLVRSGESIESGEWSLKWMITPEIS